MALPKKERSIAHQVILYFCLFALVQSALFALLSFLFLYNLEDAFLERELADAARTLEAEHVRTGKWPLPAEEHIRIYEQIADLPGDLRFQILEEPERKEFSGEEGRYYHVLPLGMSGDVLLVAEVGSSLLVRPIREEILLSFIILASILTLGALFISYRLAQKSVAPLIRLATFVEKTRPEDLPADFAREYPANEIGTLANALQKTMDRIRLFIRREQNFSRDVSHDLRTPLSVIATSSELLQNRDNLPANIRPIVQRIADASRHMQDTVNALLSLAREKKSEADLSKTDILPTVEKTILQLSHLLANKQVEVKIDIPSKVSLLLQPGVLEILLSNLIGNSFQYTRAGTVTIHYRENCLTVTDTGGGIQNDLQAHVFSDYTKGAESSGFGLGLSIVSRICEHHDISLSIKHAPGGTSIEMKFPASAC